MNMYFIVIFYLLFNIIKINIIKNLLLLNFSIGGMASSDRIKENHLALTGVLLRRGCMCSVPSKF